VVDAGGDDQSPPFDAYTRGILERLGRSGRFRDGGSGYRDPNSGLGDSAGELLRRLCAEADLRIDPDRWDEAGDPDCRQVLESTAQLVRAIDRELPAALLGLADDALIVQSFEGAASLAWERQHHLDLLSEELRSRLEWGDELLPAEYDDVLRRAAHARSEEVIDELFADADVLITPAVTGEAPEGLGFTGDPRVCRLWTLLGLPALSVPGHVGASGLPIGVQLIARARAEDVLIQAGHELAARLR
jgi:Asp-tRNA(Asn)/Glu-tRNA(Gln) amidotransferase A subunit family amidase